VGYSPHIPRWGAPQLPQGPVSCTAVAAEPPDTAKIESSFSTSGLSQLLQTTSVALELTIFSNLVPHSRHLYSKIGIDSPPCSMIREKNFGRREPNLKPDHQLLQQINRAITNAAGMKIVQSVRHEHSISVSLVWCDHAGPPYFVARIEF
jgi:hypothetical protein